jgi:UDP-N-acetyl-D-mannosaminuronate dehydrogenase
MNICIPYSEKFIEIVRDYQKRLEPKITVIHSTVPVGTTREIGNAVHSPVLGKHGRMREDLRTYPKWIGGDDAEKVAPYFEAARIRANVVKTPEETELLKLLCLAKYGMAIAFSIYQKRLCEQFGIDYNDIHLWDTFYNEGVMPSLKRPLINPPMVEKIGGHCVIPGARILNSQFANPILQEVLKYE